MSLSELLGDEIEDPDEEHFLLFSSSIPSSNLGFISSASATLDITVNSTDLTIHQSPGLLSSNAASGTTGAVLWKITPLVAEWLARPDNFLFREGILRSDGSSDDGDDIHILELGCGIAGVIALTLQKRVARYVATDLDYVLKGLRRNLVENGAWPSDEEKSGDHANRSSQAKSQKSKSKKSYSSASTSSTSAAGRAKTGTSKSASTPGSIEAVDLDWTESTPELIQARVADAEKIGLVLACDCIYNESLVDAFVQACVDASLLSSGTQTTGVPPALAPICLVAQQLRSDIVFEAWLRAFYRRFHTWRVPDELLTDGLRLGSGYVLHVGVLREEERGRG